MGYMRRLQIKWSAFKSRHQMLETVTLCIEVIKRLILEHFKTQVNGVVRNRTDERERDIFFGKKQKLVALILFTLESCNREAKQQSSIALIDIFSPVCFLSLLFSSLTLSLSWPLFILSSNVFLILVWVYFFTTGQSQPLFVYFRSFHAHFLQKNCMLQRIRTRIVVVGRRTTLPARPIVQVSKFFTLNLTCFIFENLHYFMSFVFFYTKLMISPL